jgi:hypothetical protein
MTFRERVEALPIRPIGHISHGANPSLKIHLLPNAGTDRNVRSSEYLAEPAVDQCIVGQCSSFLLSSNCFFTSQLVPFISRPDSRQIAFKAERFHHVPSTEVAKRSSLTKSRLNTPRTRLWFAQKGCMRVGRSWGTSFIRFRRTNLEGTCFLGARRLGLEALSRVRRHVHVSRLLNSNFSADRSRRVSRAALLQHAQD